MWGPLICVPGARPAKRLLAWIDDGSWFTQKASIVHIGFLVNDHALNLRHKDKPSGSLTDLPRSYLLNSPHHF